MPETPVEALPLENASVPAPAAEAVPDGYQVRLDVFEGPLDLLLFLIRKKKIDIHDIPIAAITRDYLEYLERKTEINLDREAEFLFIAALLIYIKSQMLLPRETDLAEHEDPRRVLIDRLVEYGKVKAACSLLREREDVQILQWKRDFIPPLSGESELEPVELALFDLAESFFLMMKRRAADDTRVIRGRDVSIEVKMKELVTLLHDRQMIDFLEYFEAHESLEEALVSFFCILELVKSRVAVAVQDELFQTIRGRGIQIIRTGGGWLFATKPAHDREVRRLLQIERKNRLSSAGLETLAAIAYRQPVTQSEISAIRGVDSTGALKTLLEKKLVKIVGRKKAPGNPLVYRTSEEFLLYLGLDSLDELPSETEIAKILEEEKAVDA